MKRRKKASSSASSGNPSRKEQVQEQADWDQLVEWTGRVDPASVDALSAARTLDPFFPLLHAVAGRSKRDFFARVAALETLATSSRVWFSPEDLKEELYWLEEEPRKHVLQALRASDWLEFDPERGTAVTSQGEWACTVLRFLRRETQEGELRPAVEGLRVSLELDEEHSDHLLSVRKHLVDLYDRIERARASHSAVILRREKSRLSEAIDLSAAIRELVDRATLDDSTARGVARAIHDLLSRLHYKAGELHGDITELGRQHLELTAGVTVEQIVATLMRFEKAELADIGRRALLPGVRPPALLNVEIVASAAEHHLTRQRVAREDVVWEEPAKVDAVPAEQLSPAEIGTYLMDLETAYERMHPTPLEQIVCSGDRKETFLRMSLLPLVGEKNTGTGEVAKLGAIDLDVRVSGDGYPTSLDSRPIRQLTPGEVRPKQSGRRQT